MDSSNLSLNEPLAGRFAASHLCIEAARGPVLTDVHGKQHIDFVLGNLTQIFGHNKLDATSRVEACMKRFLNVGDHPFALAERVSKRLLAISKKDSLRFTNSGSEAVHLALRLARAATGRYKIVKFVGHYHGWLDTEIGSFLRTPVSVGLSRHAGADVIQIPWNDVEALHQVIEENRESIAAIICEPVLAHAGTIPPLNGFLATLREVATEQGSCLIFDECITGFRLAPGGAQEAFGVNADVVIYSKALSNGFPLAVVAGSERFMAPARSWDVFHASSYDGNPLALTMADVVLDEIEHGSGLSELHTASDEMGLAVKKALESNGFPVCLQAAPGFFQVFFTEKDTVANYDDTMATAWPLHKLLCEGLRERNIVVSPGDLNNRDPDRNWLGSWFLSASHDSAVVSTVAAAVDDVARQMPRWSNE